MTKVSNGVKEFYNYIDRLLLNNSLSHAYLIEINDYDRDYADVLKFVKLILCKNNKLTADLNCDLCNICNLIDNNLYPDLYVIEPDGAFIKKEQIVKLEEEVIQSSLGYDYYFNDVDVSVNTPDTLVLVIFVCVSSISATLSSFNLSKLPYCSINADISLK